MFGFYFWLSLVGSFGSSLRCCSRAASISLVMLPFVFFSTLWTRSSVIIEVMSTGSNPTSAVMSLPKAKRMIAPVMNRAVIAA